VPSATRRARSFSNALSDMVEESRVDIHYLGHAAFLLRFGNVSVLVDYGEENAWVEHGWDSPILDIGTCCPDLAVYSHMHHADHYAPSRLSQGTPVWPFEKGMGNIGDVAIETIGLHEQEITSADIRAHLFTYRELRVLHLGDCQADIMHVAELPHRAWLLDVLPIGCDVVLMPIESQEEFPESAALFLQLLQARFAVPMHYWSEESRDRFVDAVSHDVSSVTIVPQEKAQLAIQPGDGGSRLALLERAPFRGWSGSESEVTQGKEGDPDGSA